jgi:hypothetical protein
VPITCNSPSAAPLETPNTPAYTRRSPPGCAVLVHRASRFHIAG